MFGTSTNLAKLMVNTSTKIAIQAAVAVALAVLVSHVFELNRSYWAILTAMVLISQTWGESLKKGIERVLMTIVGGVAGTILFFLIGDHVYWELFFLMTSVFFMMYFWDISYQVTVFFVTMYVVFLFAELSGWSLEMLGARIYETAIGSGIAIFTSAVVFPVKARVSIPSMMADYLVEIKKTVSHVFFVIKTNHQDTAWQKDRTRLVKKFSELRTNAMVSGYELVFTRFNRRKIKLMMHKLRTITHYSTSLLEAASMAATNQALPEIEVVLQRIERGLQNNLSVLVAKYRGEAIGEFSLLAEEGDALNAKLVDLYKSERASQSELFYLYSFWYFAKKLNEVMREMSQF
jgi:uncharacterized membrane protein YccC